MVVFCVNFGFMWKVFICTLPTSTFQFYQFLVQSWKLSHCHNDEKGWILWESYLNTIYFCGHVLHYFKCFLPNLSILRKVSWTFYLFGEFINYFNLFCRFQHFYFLTSSEDKFIYVANFLCCFYLSLPRIICHNTEQVERSDLHHKKILNSRLISLRGLHN